MSQEVKIIADGKERNEIDELEIKRSERLWLVVNVSDLVVEMGSGCKICIVSRSCVE